MILKWHEISCLFRHIYHNLYTNSKYIKILVRTYYIIYIIYLLLHIYESNLLLSMFSQKHNDCIEILRKKLRKIMEAEEVS